MANSPECNSIPQRQEIVEECQRILEAHKSGALGECALPEDSAPHFAQDQLEAKLTYFTLPMSLNYRRNSDQLWAAALETYEDPSTRDAYSLSVAADLSLDGLRELLVKHKLAQQPTRHTLNWHTIAETVSNEWGSFNELFASVDFDFLKLQQVVQGSHRKGFPYLAGPKLFNYWCFVLDTKCDVTLENKEYIDIAVDTHITRCSIALGVIAEKELLTISSKEIASRWRGLLAGSGIAPMDLNVPLWFWSRNGFSRPTPDTNE